MIELPTDFVSDLVTSANEQIANFTPLLLLVMGLLLAVIAIGFLIRFLNR